MSHHLSGPGQAFAGAQGSFVTVSLLSAICLLSLPGVSGMWPSSEQPAGPGVAQVLSDLYLTGYHSYPQAPGWYPVSGTWQEAPWWS
jgi:hypothetical protein